MTRHAEAEGLTLQPSDNKTGFKGVSFISGRSKPYQAVVRRGGKRVSLGNSGLEALLDARARFNVGI